METALHHQQQQQYLYLARRQANRSSSSLLHRNYGGGGGGFDMRYLIYPRITAHQFSILVYSSRFPKFFCLNNNNNNNSTPTIMAEKLQSESSSTIVSTAIINSKKPETDERKPPIPPPPEKPLPGDCCGSGCVRCVWDIYYEELEEYNNLYKSNPESDSVSDSLSNIKPKPS